MPILFQLITPSKSLKKIVDVSKNVDKDLSDIVSLKF